jgi:uncharacterized protein YndB with AHSA1/START domain
MRRFTLVAVSMLAGAGCATQHVQGSTLIARTPEAVFDTVADQRNEPQYNPEMERVELLTPEPVTAGASFRVQVRSQGELLPMTVTYTEFRRPHRLGSRTTAEAMEIAGALTFTPEAGGTRLAWQWELRPKGWLVLLGPLIRIVGSQQEERIWGALKRRLESPPPPFAATGTTSTAPAAP